MGDIWSDIFGGLLQAVPVGFQAYNAKRAADRARQEKERAQEAQAIAETAAADAKAKAAKALKDQTLAEQGLTPQGTPTQETTILGLKPIYAIGGVAALGLLGVVAAVLLKK